MAHILESLRWWVRGGGRGYVRWSIRLVVLVLVGLVLLVPYYYNITGTCRIVPAEQLGLRAQLAGQIVEMHRSAGEWVEKGDLVATLAAREEQTAVNALRAELHRVQADLDLLRAGPQPEVVSIARQRVQQSETQLEYLSSEWTRIKGLYEEQAAPLADVQRAQQLRDSAENSAIAARESLVRLEKGARPQEIAAAEADVARVQAQLDGMETMLQFTQIKAPMSGRLVTEHLASRREQNVLPGDLIAEIHDSTTLRAEVVADEAAAIYVKPGMKVNLRLWGMGGVLVSGQVTAVAPTVDEETRLWTSPIRSDRESRMGWSSLPQRAGILVDVELIDPSAELVSGMTGEAKIQVEANCLGKALLRPLVRFFRVEVWSWLP